MPVSLTSWIDPEHLALFRERHAALDLTKAELVRYIVFIGCGYSEDKAHAMAKVKPKSMEHVKKGVLV